MNGNDNVDLANRCVALELSGRKWLEGALLPGREKVVTILVSRGAADELLTPAGNVQFAKFDVIIGDLEEFLSIDVSGARRSSGWNFRFIEMDARRTYGAHSGDRRRRNTHG